MVCEQVYNSYAREASLADDAMFLKESLHGVTRKLGGWGGGAARSPPPPICTHDVFVTGSERGHMGSVFAGRMILDEALYSCAGVGEDVAPPICKQTACMMGLFPTDHGTGCQRPRGPRDQRTKGPETTGPEDRGTSGPRDQELGQTF